MRVEYVELHNDATEKRETHPMVRRISVLRMF